MAIIFADGFESGNFSAWTSITGVPTVVTSPVHRGSKSMECTATATYVTKTFAGQPIIYSRFYFRAPSVMVNDICVYALQCSGNALQTLDRDNQWTMWYHNGADWAAVTYAEPFEANRWYCLEIVTVIDAVNGEYRLFIDGVERLTVTGVDSSIFGNATSVDMGGVINWIAPFTLYVDSVIVSDSYIGPDPATLILSLRRIQTRGISPP